MTEKLAFARCSQLERLPETIRRVTGTGSNAAGALVEPGYKIAVLGGIDQEMALRDTNPRALF